MSLLRRHGLIQAVDTGILVPEGLIAYFTFDSSDIVWTDVGTEIKDGLGQGQDCATTNMSVANEVAGPMVGALDFDKNNESFILANSSAWGDVGSSPFALSVWAKITSYTNTPALVGKSDLETHGYKLRTYVSGVQFVARDSVDSAEIVVTFSTTEKDTWRHWVLNCIPGGTSTLYRDNVVVATGTGDAGNLDNTSMFCIGVNNYSGETTTYLDAAVDSPRVYNRTLSDTERQTLFDAGSPP